MQIIYKYDEIEYTSEQDVRNAINKKERKALPAQPEGTEARVEFWAQYDVEYIERADPEPVQPDIEQVRSQKMNELDSKFNAVMNDCYIVSSTGYKVNGDINADRNVQRLIQYFPTGVETIEFCDYNNEIINLTKEQLEIIAQEIVINAQNLYNQKWDYRKDIKEATSVDYLLMLEIKFETMRFID